MTPIALDIRLFGELELIADDARLTPFESARAGSLLAYLLLHRDAPQPRQQVAFRLWPDSTESQARTNLRHVLHTLRRTLPDCDRYVDIRPRTLQWRPDAPARVDVAVFEQSLASAKAADDATAVAALREAVSIYRGPLLDASYEEWLVPARDALQRQFVHALDRLVRVQYARGEYADAILHAERLLRHDPLREEMFRLLIDLHRARGDRARALHVYHECVAVLERELGVGPSPATRAAYDAIVRIDDADVDHATAVGRPTAAPLVGRTGEWECLTRMWRQAEAGCAQMVLITGEAGIGKTRLVEELCAWCAQRGGIVVESRSYAAEGALAYAPVAEWLRTHAIASQLPRLEPAHLAELARLVPELHADGTDPWRSPTPSDTDRRRRLFDAAAHAFRDVGAPVLLVAEDVQWADRETLRFVHYLARTSGDARLAIVLTARTEDLNASDGMRELAVALRTLDASTIIDLGRLTPAETLTLAERAAGTPLPASAHRLFDETGGNPLFIVEAVRSGWLTAAEAGGWMTPKVQAVIETRLAQLSPTAREVVEMAAAVGREFSIGVLALATALSDERLAQALDELWRRGIVRERGADAYDFSHDKIREVAYERLGPAVRRRHHLRVARALESLGDADALSAQLAAHYERAGALETAVLWYERAAAVAQRLNAETEGIRLLERALRLLSELPDTRGRWERELAIHTTLPALLGAVEGFASERLTASQDRALALTRMLGLEPSAPLLRSLAIVSLSKSEFDSAGRYAAELAARAAREGDDVSAVEASYVLGIVAFWQGDLHGAQRAFEAAIDRYRPEFAATHIARYGLDPCVVCRSRLANTLWMLGHTEQALVASDHAVEHARSLGHLHTLAVALVFATMLAIDSHDDARVRSRTEQLARVCEQMMGPQVTVALEAFLGYLDALDGTGRAGVDRVRRALDSLGEVTPAPGMRATLVRVALQACVDAGEVQAGLALADEALTRCGDVRVWEAEFRRLRAVLLSASGGSPDEVKAELGRALSVARAQGARAFEARIAIGAEAHS